MLRTYFVKILVIVLIVIHLMKMPTATYTSNKNIPKNSIILNVNGFAILEHSSVAGTVILMGLKLENSHFFH